jgi:beta-phosphoglucomutase-like phosphatase (HAD superfamily)
MNHLEATPDSCLLITSSTADIKTAQAVKASCVGYARTPDDAAHLVDAGAITFVYSMAAAPGRMRGGRAAWRPTRRDAPGRPTSNLPLPPDDP